MSVAVGYICWLLGSLAVAGLLLLAAIRMAKRWKRNMNVSDDPDYAATLATLSEASVRHFNPYTDVDWKAPVFSVTQNDPRWALSATDPLNR